MEVNKGWCSGAHFDLITIDDVEETSASPLTEEMFREWLLDAFTSSTASSGTRTTATEVIQKEQSKKLARLLILKQQAKKRARKLLRRFITPVQWQDYNSLGYFSQKDGKGRTWKFKKEHHYPIECDGQPICIDPEWGAPDEDLLLQVWLEIIGGRGTDILPDYPRVGLHYNIVIMDDVFTAPQRHGILQGIT